MKCYKTSSFCCPPPNKQYVNIAIGKDDKLHNATTRSRKEFERFCQRINSRARLITERYIWFFIRIEMTFVISDSRRFSSLRNISVTPHNDLIRALQSAFTSPSMSDWSRSLSPRFSSNIAARAKRMKLSPALALSFVREHENPIPEDPSLSRDGLFRSTRATSRIAHASARYADFRTKLRTNAICILDDSTRRGNLGIGQMGLFHVPGNYDHPYRCFLGRRSFI